MKVAVIGAGASGLICAASIAHNAKVNKLPVKVVLFESKDKPGKKILATGNGRCNLMNENSGVSSLGPIYQASVFASSSLAIYSSRR